MTAEKPARSRRKQIAEAAGFREHFMPVSGGAFMFTDVKRAVSAEASMPQIGGTKRKCIDAEIREIKTVEHEY